MCIHTFQLHFEFNHMHNSSEQPYNLYQIYSNFQMESVQKTRLSENLKTIFSEMKQGYSWLSLLLNYFETLFSAMPYFL